MSLTYLGTTSFVQFGAPRWGSGGFDLDSLSVTYMGPTTGINSFLNSLSQGQSSTIDGNMALTDWNPGGGGSGYTQVILNYLGARNSRTIPGKNSTGRSLQTATYVKGSGEAEDSKQYQFQYLSPTASLTWISTVAEQGGSAATPSGDVILIGWQIGRLSSNVGTFTPDDGRLLFDAIFNPLIVPSYSSEEIVPSRYWRNTHTNTLIYTR